MEHESDDDVLIIEDETEDQINVEFKVEPSTTDLFRQIDEALSEEPVLTKSRHVPIALSQPAVISGRLKRAFKPVQAPDQGMPRIVKGSVTNVTVTPIVAGPSKLSDNLLNRLGPVVLPLASRLGPPSTSVAPRSNTPIEEQKVKRPRGPDRRPEQYRALTQQGLATLNLPELVRHAVDRLFYTAAQYN
jgi:hypothetical protein